MSISLRQKRQISVLFSSPNQDPNSGKFFCNYFNLLPNTYTQRYIHICHSFIPNSGIVNRSKTPQFQQGFYKWKKCSKPTNNITGNMEKFTKFTKRNPWITGTKQIKSPNCWHSIRGRERGVRRGRKSNYGETERTTCNQDSQWKISWNQNPSKRQHGAIGCGPYAPAPRISPIQPNLLLTCHLIRSLHSFFLHFLPRCFFVCGPLLCTYITGRWKWWPFLAPVETSGISCRCHPFCVWYVFLKF